MTLTIDSITTPIQRLWVAFDSVWTAKLFMLEDKEISLSFILQVIISVILAFLIARGIKALIKRFLLSRLNLHPGSVESLSALTGYVLTVITSVIFLQSLGIGLSSLTIFAGAIGIGFGIGLQDLASNFISGITVLLEQQIKVGDFIEVDGITGKVENISIRSTTIETEDGNFAIVPNKKFLDSNVINWTYKGERGRIHIPLDVPDTSDPLVVAESLLAAARREPRTLATPFPEILFRGYREGMDFDLLIWIDDIQKKEEVTSNIYFMIEEEMRERGIKRSIPQRKLYIDNLKELTSALKRSENIESNGSYSAEVESVATAPALATKTPVLKELLRKISYFSKCNDLELRHIILRGYRRSLEPQEVICKENDPGDSFYIILSGSVEVYVESIGKQVAIRYPGEFIGEMSLLMGTPRTATLRTLENTVLFVVDRGNLQSLLEKQPTLADKMSEELAKRQETLEKLGIKFGVEAEEETPFQQIRKHIRSLFGI